MPDQKAILCYEPSPCLIAKLVEMLVPLPVTIVPDYQRAKNELDNSGNTFGTLVYITTHVARPEDLRQAVSNMHDILESARRNHKIKVLLVSQDSEIYVRTELQLSQGTHYDLLIDNYHGEHAILEAGLESILRS